MIFTYHNEDCVNSVGKKNMKLPTKIKIERFSGHIGGEGCIEMGEKAY